MGCIIGFVLTIVGTYYITVDAFAGSIMLLCATIMVVCSEACNTYINSQKHDIRVYENLANILRGGRQNG